MVSALVALTVFFFFKIYLLFIYCICFWLRWVLVAARGIFRYVVRAFHCGAWASL